MKIFFGELLFLLLSFPVYRITLPPANAVALLSRSDKREEGGKSLFEVSLPPRGREEKRRIPFFAISRFPTERRGKEGRAENNSFFFLLLQKITSSFLFPLEFRATGEIKRFFFLLSLPLSFAASWSIIYLG